MKKLLNFQHFCETHLESKNLTSIELDDLKSLMHLLEPVYITTQKLQEKQLYFSDFYKLWMKMKLRVKAMKSSYSIILVDCLEKREVHLLDNDIVFTALYLDPRLRRILLQTPNNMIRARKFLNFSKKKSDDVSSNVLNNQIDLITNYDVNESESNFTLILRNISKFN
ncbi:uncharacterized protein LOC124419913 [Lucilia cuprina]|uniref:uncharacterized protein LOC124419913 n=1 Tax=Lucilia cuprina TaxID=7375 RepID=UPI001F05685E|nr:uncharacterized protein LOC124419913 [Lucilia cuprina]